MERPINLCCPRSKVKAKIEYLAITFVLFGVHTSNLSHIVAYGKANKSLMFKVKGQGQGHLKYQNNILAITLVLFAMKTSNLSHIVAYGKANTFLTSKVKDQGQGLTKFQKNVFLTLYMTLTFDLGCQNLFAFP